MFLKGKFVMLKVQYVVTITYLKKYLNSNIAYRLIVKREKYKWLIILV